MLTKQVLNAAMLLCELKDNPGIKLIDFCDDKKLSKHFMEQIGRRLVEAKIIISKRGPGGGYILNRKKVSLAELIKLYKENIADDPLVEEALAALEEINVLN